MILDMQASLILHRAFIKIQVLSILSNKYRKILASLNVVNDHPIYKYIPNSNHYIKTKTFWNISFKTAGECSFLKCDLLECCDDSPVFSLNFPKSLRNVPTGI